MECREQGWQAWLFAVEVGCRGFPVTPTYSVWSVLTALCRIGEAAPIILLLAVVLKGRSWAGSLEPMGRDLATQ